MTPVDSTQALPGVYFDDRSARLDRMTGWERVSRNIATRLPASVRRGVGSADSPFRLLLSDWVQLPAATRDCALIHFPTYPPSPSVRAPVLMTVHDLTPWLHPSAMSRGNRWYFHRNLERQLKSAHIHTVSNSVASELTARLGLSSDRIHVIPNGVDVQPPASEPPRDRKRPYVVALGTLEPRKNLGRLIRAFAQSRLRASHDLVLVGRVGWGGVAARGWAEQGVVHVDTIDDNELATLICHATALISVSLYEGFGLPVAEALAQGVPVIASDIPAHREVSDGAATLVDPLDLDAIRLSLDAAPHLDPPDSEPFRRRFSWDSSVHQLLLLYADLTR